MVPQRPVLFSTGVVLGRLLLILALVYGTSLLGFGGEWQGTVVNLLITLAAISVFVQAVMVPMLAINPDEIDVAFPHLRPVAFVIIVLGLLAVEAILVCVWRLVTMVRRGTVFTNAAFRYVDVVIGAIVVAAVLTFGLAAIMAPIPAVPPAGVLLACGAAVATLGGALIVLVLRMLLAQAVARDVEATQMQAELDEVI